jgi:hypothetical protein
MTSSYSSSMRWAEKLRLRLFPAVSRDHAPLNISKLHGGSLDLAGAAVRDKTGGPTDSRPLPTLLAPPPADRSPSHRMPFSLGLGARCQTKHGSRFRSLDLPSGRQGFRRVCRARRTPRGFIVLQAQRSSRLSPEFGWSAQPTPVFLEPFTLWQYRTCTLARW